MAGLSGIQCLKTSNGSYIATDTTKDFRLTKQHPEATQYLLDARGQACSWWAPRNDVKVINPTALIWDNLIIMLFFDSSYMHSLCFPRTRSVLWSHPALWKVPHEDLFTKGSWNGHAQFRRSSEQNGYRHFAKSKNSLYGEIVFWKPERKLHCIWFYRRCSGLPFPRHSQW